MGRGRRSKKAERGKSQHWKYEAEERPKRKHAWDKPYPGFVKHRGAWISKCPKGLSTKEAERLLNSQSLAYPLRRWGKQWPDRLYVVHEGCVYKALVTRPGVSYHAFPELPERLRRLPKEFRDRLLDLARRLGCEDEVRRWIRK